MDRNSSVPIFVIVGIGVVLFTMALIQTYLHKIGERNSHGYPADTTVNNVLEAITCLGVVVVVTLFIALFGIMAVMVYDLMRRFSGE